MSDFNQPTTSSNYLTEILQDLKGRDVDAVSLCLVDPTNIPTGAIKYLRASDKFQEWNGSAWVDKVLSIAGGGTGASTAGTARTALGLGTMAVQNSSTVAITGGAIAGVALDADDLSSGTVAVARLGSGSGGAGAKALFDDNTWKSVADSFPVGGIVVWPTAAAPSGWQLLDGSAINRVTYSILFALLGTTYGVGNGTTTFNVPDFRGRFVLGKATAGTGSTLGGTFGTIDHIHTGPSHTHTVAVHHHTGPSHTHTISSDGDHQHGVQGSTDGESSHTHSFSGTTDGDAGGFFHDGSGGNDVAVSGHTHTYSGTTGAGSNHAHTLSNPTAFTNVSGAHTHGAATGASGTGNTGDTALTTDASGTGNTGTANPPGIAMNYIIRLG